MDTHNWGYLQLGIVALAFGGLQFWWIASTLCKKDRQGPRLSGEAAPLSRALDAHLRLLAQSGGTRFGMITQQAIRQGSFSSVKELIVIAKTEQFVDAYNKTKAPFNWTATADSILKKLKRLCSQICGTGH